MTTKFFDLSFRGIDGRTPYDFGNSLLGSNVHSCTYGKGGMLYIQNSADVWTSAISDISTANGEILIQIKTLRDSTTQFSNNPGIAPGLRAQALNTDKMYYAANGSLPSFSRMLSVYSREFPGSGQLNLGANGNALSSKSNPEFYNLSRFLRFRVDGTSLMARSWWEGGSEPTTWQVTSSNSLYNSGYFGLIFQGLQANCLVPFVSIATDGDTAPSSMTKRKIEGLLLNPDNSPAGNQIVRFYFKATGKLIGEVTTDALGSYSFLCNVYENELVQVIGVDKNNNAWVPPANELYPMIV